ncbi:sialate O-acetylesterase [soil metagenome]
MKKNVCFPLLLLILAALAFPAHANVQLPAIFGNHMVLQQNADVTIWGWAKAGEEVTVTPSWDHESLKVKASNLARWEVKVKTPGAGGPHSLKFQGYNTLVIDDILMGEVWLCSGQSNMEWPARAKIDHAEKVIAEANFPSIRFFTVAHRTADAPQLDLGGQWVVCTPETMIDFSAVGYFFGKEIHQNLNVPVGLINSSWGGTPAELWVNPKVITEDKGLSAAAAQQQEVPYGPEQPGKAYHAMIAPLIPFRIAGALWYQGESNTVSPDNYAQLLPALIRNWRSEWGSEFPFYYVQIAPYKNYGGDSGVRLRDAQRQVMNTVPNTGMVVVSDIGNVDDIHPRNKIDVGKRLAAWALNKTYGKKEIPISGPLYREMKVEGNKIRVFFDHAEQGLVAKGKTLTHFEIAGSDGDFVPATAKIEGNTVVVQARGVKNPVAVRFAWGNAAEPNLFNKAGLPASSFRSDSGPVAGQK